MATKSKNKKSLVKVSVKDARSITSDKRIILCLSGGGLRATLFHIGCIRALRENSLLQNVSQIFAVSGGTNSCSAFGTELGEIYQIRLNHLTKSHKK